MPAIELSDQDGRTRRLRDLITDEPVVVSFFFTACARVCPPQTALLRDLQSELSRRAGTSHPLLLSVSLNPLADTPAAIRAYASLFDARLGDAEGWLMLTGSPSALSPLWAAFDAGAEDLDGHSGTLWIGHPASHRWTRVTALSAEITPASLADLLLQEDR